MVQRAYRVQSLQGSEPTTTHLSVPQHSLLREFPSYLQQPLRGQRGNQKVGHLPTYRDQHAVLPLELGDVRVSAGHLRLVQRSEAAHHLDGALRGVRHPHGRARLAGPGSPGPGGPGPDRSEVHGDREGAAWRGRDGKPLVLCCCLIQFNSRQL